MSLLNDMLRDLSQQEKSLSAPELQENKLSQANLAQNSDRELFEQSSLATIKRIPWLPSIVVFCSVLIISLLVKHYVVQKEPAAVVVIDVVENTKTKESTIGITPIVEISTDNNVLLAAEQQAASLDTGSTSEPILLEQLNNQRIIQTKQLDELILLAEQALVSDRLTTPIETSAYAYYQEALKLDPENSAAKLGMQRIAERYLAMTGLAETTDSMWTDAELKRATGLVKRAAWVAPSYTAIEWYESRLDQLVNNSTDSSSLEIGVGASEGEEIPTTTTALVTAVGTVAGEDVVIASESQVPKNSTAIIDPFGEQALNAEEAQLSVVTNTHWQDQQAVMQAKKLIAQGDALAAEVLLKKTLTHIETPTLSAAYLLELYSQQTRIHDFSALLEDVTYLSELDRQYFSAKQALLQGDELKAIELLEAQLAAAESHENYRALLAGLYQHSGQYVQASNSYRRLLASFGDKPAYWLGFALALDALNQKSSALQAYKRLDSYRELEAAVRDYIVQRIHALSSE